MTLRRKIAELLHRAARSIDDTPRRSREERWAATEARLAAIFAIPRAPSRFISRKTFSNERGGLSVLNNPLVLKIADEFERDEPGLYADNPDMEEGICRYRAEQMVDKIRLEPGR